MTKNKSTTTYNEHLDNMVNNKEQLPFHKMDDVSRRKFIQSIGYFMGALTVPSIVRLETMSKLSKKLFGNSLAFAANASGTTTLSFQMRAGYAYSSWLVGNNSDDEMSTPADRNMAWGPDTVTSVATAYTPVKLPSQSMVLAPYANGIQSIHCFNSEGNHTDMFRMNYMPGVGELVSMRAKTDADAGGQYLITQPFGYFNSADFAVQNVPAMLAQYAPASYSNIRTVPGLFTPPTLLTNKNNALSSNLQKSIFSAMESSFSKDVKKGLYEKGRDLTLASNSQAFKILSTNYQAALDPAQNMGTINMLKAGLPPQVRMSCPVDPAEAMFQIITASALGITPPIGMLGFLTSDWHFEVNRFNMGDDGAGDLRTQSAAYLAKLIRNVFDAANAGVWVNAITGQNQKIEIVFSSEFTRSITIDGEGNGPANDDNGDGYTNGTLIMSSDVNQSKFKAGSYGRCAPNNQVIGFNTSTLIHNPNIGTFTTMQAFHHNAALFGVKPSDFGILGNGIGGNMVS